ncbi:hypothetical protein ASG97_21540 [Bacillus sp. Soil745]|nr:hypothetical protein ASG97_21540 [Bacillus sp. Soil745]
MTPKGKASPGEAPQAQRRRGGFPERPRKAIAWRVDQRTICTNPKFTVDKLALLIKEELILMNIIFL